MAIGPSPRERVAVVRDFFNRRASTWDTTVSMKDGRRLEQLVPRFELAPGSTVLDAGAGTGVIVPHLRRTVGAGGRVIALDAASEMLVRARRKLNEMAAGYLCADMTAIPLDGGAVDAVVCYSSFPHFRDKPQALGEIFRVTGRGGRLFIAHSSDRMGVNRRHRHTAEVTHDMLPNDDEMLAMLTDAGFIDVHIEDRPDSYLARAQKPGLENR